MESRTRICVFDYATTPDEAVPGAGSIRRMITRENSGMNLPLSKGTLKPGAGHAWHAHETQDEAVFILEGEGTMHIEGYGDVRYRPGMSIVIPRGVRHYNENTSGADAVLISIFNPALR